MRSAAANDALTDDQKRAADAGMKAMMPIGNRPFLDFILSAIAEGGVDRVGVVVAPDHQSLQRYYTVAAPPARVRIDFLVQERPLGTADAVLSAEAWVRDEPFLVLNGDNLYPAEAIREIAGANEPALLGFEREVLLHSSNIDAARIGAFALIETDGEGYLARIMEKPNPGEADPAARISMNCWRFDGRIFDACRQVPLSPRGEYELPSAVAHAMQRGMRFRVLPTPAPVLDLSQRADAAEVARRLAGVTPQP